MARRPRLFVADVPYHVVQRGNNRIPIFLTDRDYLFFLEALREAKTKHPCLIYSYCLMANHFHLLIEPKEKDNNESTGNLYFSSNSREKGKYLEARYEGT